MVQGTINLLSKVGTVAAFLLFVSCDSLFHQYRGVGGCWALSDTLTFTYTPTNEEKQNCRLDIELRSSNDYKYKEIFLRVERFSKRQKETVVDTLRCELYDDLGHTRGTTAGILWQTSFPVDTIEILPNDTVTVRVSHLMDDKQLKGVSDVGIRLSHCGRHQSLGN